MQLSTGQPLADPSETVAQEIPSTILCLSDDIICTILFQSLDDETSIEHFRLCHRLYHIITNCKRAFLWTRFRLPMIAYHNNYSLEYCQRKLGFLNTSFHHGLVGQCTLAKLPTQEYLCKHIGGALNPDAHQRHLFHILFTESTHGDLWHSVTLTNFGELVAFNAVLDENARENQDKESQRCYLSNLETLQVDRLIVHFTISQPSLLPSLRKLAVRAHPQFQPCRPKLGPGIDMTIFQNLTHISFDCSVVTVMQRILKATPNLVCAEFAMENFSDRTISHATLQYLFLCISKDVPASKFYLDLPQLRELGIVGQVHKVPKWLDWVTIQRFMPTQKDTEVFGWNKVGPRVTGLTAQHLLGCPRLETLLVDLTETDYRALVDSLGEIRQTKDGFRLVGTVHPNLTRVPFLSSMVKRHANWMLQRAWAGVYDHIDLYDPSWKPC